MLISPTHTGMDHPILFLSIQSIAVDLPQQNNSFKMFCVYIYFKYNFIIALEYQLNQFPVDRFFLFFRKIIE